MTGTGNKTATGTARRGRRSSPFLNAGLILDTAMAVIERDGPEALTFRRLGADLGADHTAVLRHFGSKDELLLALAARLVEEALEGFTAGADWRETLASLARRTRAACRAHPGVAVLVAARTSRRAAEFQGADIVIGALFEAGLQGREAASYYRALVDTALALSAYEASVSVLDERAREGDDQAWQREYLAASPQRYPHLASVAHHLADIDAEDQFETAIGLFIDAIEIRAQRARDRRHA
ncbi:TetR/AcrR family transcriptional regulator [Streptantibioticus ferralitis]|uniref:TetR/AcrR family transcriptional regulator n=1 Tax=Streptantibioticus ferralitis TaxID=236510 RepID=A0ABT5Z9L1_9ACTN|nr:TetR/AcrR family transcriptional regulator [Streptantibioticus ferralitis]MDF2260513.1 TetR/AcrR family transcriptional regulator [Streptantibioticus ferralitis]